MAPRSVKPASKRSLPSSALWAVFLLGTAAATWLWAHEGHQPLASKGAQVDPANPDRLILSGEARSALDVQTGEVRSRFLDQKVLAYATLVTPWRQHAFVTSRFPGRITKLNARPGQKVSAGDTLAEVESLELKNLALELLKAQNDVELSGKILEQIEPLVQGGTVSAQRLLEARSKHQQNLNAVEVARSKWLSVGLSAEDLAGLLGERNPRRVGSLPLSSPVGGVVAHADLAVGQVVGPKEHLFEVVDHSAVWVKIGILERDLYRVAVGQPVELSLAAYPGEVFRTKVQAKAVYLDPVSHLGTLWADLANPPGHEPRFLPGMNGQAQVVIPGDSKLPAVPAAAVVSDGAERYVLVEESATADRCTYVKRNVVVRGSARELVHVEGGVFPGDRVVTRGAHQLGGFFVQGVLRLSPEACKNVGLRVEPAGPRAVEDVLEVDGTVEIPPGRRAFASSQVGGTLERIHVERSQPVKQGQVVAEVASLELQDLQLELLRVHLEKALLEKSLKQLLGAGEAFSRRESLELESRVNAVVFQLGTLRQKLGTIGLSGKQIEELLAEKKLVERLPVRAPVDGTVVNFDKVLGQVIRPEEPLFEVHDLSRLWVRAHLSEREHPQVRIGQPARVRFVAAPGAVAEGKVTRSGRVFRADNRTLSVWVELDPKAQPPALHNMLARIALTVRDREPALALPRAALVSEGLLAYVFVRKDDGGFERRAVEAGRSDDRFVEIRRGLRPGEMVVVGGAQGMQTAYAALR